MNFGFIIDNRKCIGCHACTVACKSEHDVPIGVNRTWVKYIEKGEFPHARRLFSVMRCNHCADAPCVEICPVTALYTRADGIVDFDNRRCIACKACMQACPYDALYIDPQTETAAKCNYCAHRVEIGLEPSCVVVCPEHAIISGDMDDPNSEISQLLAHEQVTARKVEKGTQPKLFYIDGDEGSLTPTQTQTSDAYMWSSQSAGVGHYAKYAEARKSQADGKTWVGEKSDSPVLVPDGEDDLKMLQKAQAVLKETARRTYDAPREGVLWDWKVAAYIWTKAIAAGTFLVLFLASVLNVGPLTDSTIWLGLLTSLMFLAVTGFLLVKDLDQPRRFLYVLLRPQWRSWLVRGAYAITLYGMMLTLLIVLKFFTLGISPILDWLTAFFAIITAVYTAFLFAQAKGRDFWQNPTLSLHMFIHAVMAGAAVLAVASLFVDIPSAFQDFLRVIVLTTVFLNLTVLALDFLTPHATADVERTADMIMKGEFRALFWIGGVLVGQLIPAFALFAMPETLLPFAGLLALVGLYFLEHIWVRAPQLIPLS